MSLETLKKKVTEKLLSSKRIIYMEDAIRFVCKICTEEKGYRVSLTFPTRQIKDQHGKLSKELNEITCDECGTVYRKGFEQEQNNNPNSAQKVRKGESYLEKLERMED
jgi:hypothetical protein